MHNNNTSTIIYTGNFRFPDKDAAGARVLGIGKILRVLGYNVVFYGISDDIATDTSWNEFEGFEYFNEPARSKKFKSVFRMLNMSKSLLKIIKSHKYHVASVILYNCPVNIMYNLLIRDLPYPIPLIADCTEWYSPRQFRFNFLNPFWLDSEIRMRFMQKKVKNVICISSYLESYYKKRCNVIKVPPLVDFNDRKWSIQANIKSSCEKCLNLVYAGTPGKKDNLSLIIDAVIKLRTSGKNIRLNCLGVGIDELIFALGGSSRINAAGQGLVLHAKKPQDKVPGFLAENDFSIFLRPLKQYSQAGFPTKFVESLAAGLPVICNLTSDIKFYLQDKENGLVINDINVASICDTLNYAYNLSEQECKILKNNAKNSAQKYFSYQSYVEQFNIFINKINRQ
jgi:glycosyltransferase involved in cell wall biosynthesis